MKDSGKMLRLQVRTLRYANSHLKCDAEADNDIHTSRMSPFVRCEPRKEEKSRLRRSCMYLFLIAIQNRPELKEVVEKGSDAELQVRNEWYKCRTSYSQENVIQNFMCAAIRLPVFLPNSLRCRSLFSLSFAATTPHGIHGRYAGPRTARVVARGNASPRTLSTVRFHLKHRHMQVYAALSTVIHHLQEEEVWNKPGLSSTRSRPALETPVHII